MEDRNCTTSLHSLAGFETHVLRLELSPIKPISPMILNLRSMSAGCSTFASCILSTDYLANAKNRELSGIKHAVTRSLNKICSLSAPLRLNFRSRSAFSFAPPLFLHFKFKPCGGISAFALPPLNPLQFKLAPLPYIN